MKLKYKNKGITLIALVITIIILLILAGITIGHLTNNGLFEKVKLAKQKTEQAQNDEIEILGEYENIIEELASSRNFKETITIPNFQSSLRNDSGGSDFFIIDVGEYNKLRIGSRTCNTVIGTTYWMIEGYKNDSYVEILKTTKQSSEIEEFDISGYEKIKFSIHCTSVVGDKTWGYYYFNDINIIK